MEQALKIYENLSSEEKIEFIQTLVTGRLSDSPKSDQDNSQKLGKQKTLDSWLIKNRSPVKRKLEESNEAKDNCTENNSSNRSLVLNEVTNNTDSILEDEKTSNKELSSKNNLPPICVAVKASYNLRSKRKPRPSLEEKNAKESKSAQETILEGCSMNYLPQNCTQPVNTNNLIQYNIENNLCLEMKNLDENVDSLSNNINNESEHVDTNMAKLDVLCHYTQFDCEAFFKLKEACAQISLDLHELLQQKSIQNLISNRNYTNDSCIFIGTHQSTSEKVLPVVHAHKSKKLLSEKLNEMQIS